MISFTAIGKPEPQGSARAFVPKGWSRAVITSDNPKNKNWRATVHIAARKALKAAKGQLFDGPVKVSAIFYLPRPKALKGEKPHTTRPDADKLTRSILDAMTGVLYADDGQVVELDISKRYALVGDLPGADISVSEFLADMAGRAEP